MFKGGFDYVLRSTRGLSRCDSPAPSAHCDMRCSICRTVGALSRVRPLTARSSNPECQPRQHRSPLTSVMLCAFFLLYSERDRTADIVGHPVKVEEFRWIAEFVVMGSHSGYSHCLLQCIPQPGNRETCCQPPLGCFTSFRKAASGA